jgi:MFS family permease
VEAGCPRLEGRDAANGNGVHAVSGAAEIKSSPARIIATSFMSLFAVVGLTLYGLPLYYDKFVSELHWSRADVTAGNMLGKLLIGPVFGLLVGWIIERIGPRRPMMIGLLVAGGAVAALGLVHDYILFLALYCLNALGYVLAGPLPNQVLLAQNFKEKRGMAMGVAYLGIGIGFFCVPQITKLLMAKLGWHTALQVLGAIVIAVGMPLVLALRPGDTITSRSPKAPKASLSDVLTNRNFYLLALGSFASVGAVGGMNQHLKLLFTLDQHRAQSEALNIITWVAGVSLVGRFGAGWLADRIGPKKVMMLIYLLVASAALLLVWGPTGSTIYLFAIVFGLGLGGEYMIIPLMAGELFGTATLGRVMGIVLTFDGAAEAMFPWIVGKTHDQTNSYRLGFQILTALAALGAVAVALLPDRDRRRQEMVAPGAERSTAAS